MRQKSRVKRTKRAAGTRKRSTRHGFQPNQERDLSFRLRTSDDDAYILQLTEEQMGPRHIEAFGEPFPRERLEWYLQSGAPTVLLVLDGKRIGYYSYLMGIDGRLNLSALVLERGHQTEEIGRQVVSHVEQQAVSLGAHTVEIFVLANHEESVNFTRKLGFSEAYRPEPNTICFQKVVSSAPSGAAPYGGANTIQGGVR